ncbi:MAG: hypothetical protein R2794_10710 [Chitinophagales bacterium]
MLETATHGSRRFIVYSITLFLYVYISYFVSRTSFGILLPTFTLLFASYLLLQQSARQENRIKELIILGLLIRFILLFCMPNLTDDFYRFVWDGRITWSGGNPYAFTPYQLLQNNYDNNSIHGLNKILYNQLNSKEYFTIYPPLCQGLFAWSAALSANNVMLQVLWLKFFLFLFECGTVLMLGKVLRDMQLPVYLQFLYILNPLVILELSANIHLESLMIFFLLLAIWALVRKRTLLSAVVFGVAIGVKMWPLMFLPLLFRYLGWKQALRYCAIACMTGLALLLPMLLQFRHAAGSFNLYFRQFEYNASIFYFLKWIIGKDAHYDTFVLMRNILPFLTLAGIGILSFRYKRVAFFNALLFAFTIFCLFATTVHPWYLTPLVFLSVFSSYRYAIYWSFFIFLSYSTYRTSAYLENYGLILLEYAAVFLFFLLDLRKQERNTFI